MFILGVVYLDSLFHLICEGSQSHAAFVDITEGQYHAAPGAKHFASLVHTLPCPHGAWHIFAS